MQARSMDPLTYGFTGATKLLKAGSVLEEGSTPSHPIYKDRGHLVMCPNCDNTENIRYSATEMVKESNYGSKRPVNWYKFVWKCDCGAIVEALGRHDMLDMLQRNFFDACAAYGRKSPFEVAVKLNMAYRPPVVKTEQGAKPGAPGTPVAAPSGDLNVLADKFDQLTEKINVLAPLLDLFHKDTKNQLGIIKGVLIQSLESNSKYMQDSISAIRSLTPSREPDIPTLTELYAENEENIKEVPETQADLDLDDLYDEEGLEEEPDKQYERYGVPQMPNLYDKPKKKVEKKTEIGKRKRDPKESKKTPQPKKISKQ